MKLLAYIITFSPVFIVYLFYRLVYFKPISVILVKSDHSGSQLRLYKPRELRSLAGGSRSGFVSLGNGYYAFYYDCMASDHSIQFNGSKFNSDIYICKRNRLGRFRSLDLSSRPLKELLDRFC